MIAPSLLLDTHLAVRARLGRPPDLVHVLFCCSILIAHLVEFVTCHIIVPLALMVLAYLGLTLGTYNVWDFGQLV